MLRFSKIAMNRKYQGTAAILLITLFSLSLYYLRGSAQYYGFPSNRYHPGYRKGSSFIKKGPLAENKIVVLARVEGEDANWVDEELPE
jgi:hypothetical protein